MMLELANLGRVPRYYTLHRESVAAARTAMALLDIGALPENAPITAPVELVKLGLKKWIERHTEKLHSFRFQLGYTEHQFEEYGNQQTPIAQSDVVTISISHACAGQFLIGDKTQRAERMIRGLGETALYWLGQCFRNLTPVITPEITLDFARWNYWKGEEDETATLADASMNGDGPFEILTRAQFDKMIPRWASSPRPRINQDRLRQLANPRRRMLTGELARALVTLINALGKNRKRISSGQIEEEKPAADPLIVLRWSMKDPTAQIMDDFYEDLWQTGEEAHHFAALEFNTKAKGYANMLREFLRGTEALFEILSAMLGVVRVLNSSKTIADRYAVGDF